VSPLTLHDALPICFHRIGENRFAPMAAAFHFAGTQSQVFAQLQFARELSQRLALDQRRAHAGEVAFAGIGKLREQRFGNNQINDGIAEEFEALVVRAASASMRQRPVEQCAIRKLIAELSIKGWLRIDSAHCTADRLYFSLSNLTTTSRLAISGVRFS